MKVLNVTLFPQYKPFGAFDNADYFLATGIMLLVSYAIATLSFYLLEQPLIRYSKKIGRWFNYFILIIFYSLVIHYSVYT